MRPSLITIWSQPKKPSTAKTSALSKCSQVHITIRSTNLSKDLRPLIKTGWARVLQAITRHKSLQHQIVVREETSTILKELPTLRVPTIWTNQSKTRPMAWFQEELWRWIALRRLSWLKAWATCINQTLSTNCKRLIASSLKGQEPKRNH